jgi:DNA polymerase-3 subunit alpha
MSDFIHIHNHSEYSLLDGANRVEDLVKLAVHHQMPAVALTDHGVMHGVVEFATRCRDEGIKPLIGCETYTSGSRSRFGRDPVADKNYSHLLLIAQNETGYRNLVKLVSAANTEGFYYRPRIDHEILAANSEGLICTSACLSGELSKALLAGQYERARDTAAIYRDIFGPDRYFIEIQRHGLADEGTVNGGLVNIAKELGLRLVATNDVHYGHKEDAEPHDILLCIGTGKTCNDPGRMRYEQHEYYFKSYDEMRALFPDFPEALHVTRDIADMVDFDMTIGGMILPHYEVPEGHTYESWLEHLVMEGAARKYGNLTEEQRERIRYELQVIQLKGYSAYFLIVADFVHWAHSRNIPARCRGSAAGSVVSYLLDISNIDPLRYGLLFERFLYMERITPPDIDLDFADYRREEVIQYCREKYGPDHVAQIITFGTLGARAAIRDVCRAKDVPLREADNLAKMVPQQAGKGRRLEEAINGVPELNAAYHSNETYRQVLDTAKRLEGLSRHTSVHAAGVVITPGPVTDYLPVQKSETGLITQYDMNCVSALGLLKMDFLGLRTLTVVDQCIRMMREYHPAEIPPDFDIDSIPFDDPKTFRLLQSGQTAGVFQLESSGMRQLVQDIRPDRFEDIIPLVALFRPGPLGNGDTERFIRRRHKREKATYLHPCLEPILKDTYGIFVYQEQILKVAMQVAGLGAQDADNILRAMSKKKMDKMEAARPKFIEGACRVSGLTERQATELFDAMASFAQYGFNQNHSGAYAVLTYQTAWLKANYPTEFMAALLTSIADNKDKVAAYIDEARLMGITTALPDVNTSVADFSVDPTDESRKTIRFGLKAVRGVGDAPVEAITEARREGGPFKSIHDFCRRVDTARCQKSVIESIIKAGGFDTLHPNRAQVLAALDDAFATAQRVRKQRETGQVALFGDFGGDDGPVPDPPLPRVPEMDRRDRLAFEKELLGLYISDHPMRDYQPQVDELRRRFGETFTTSQDLQEKSTGRDVVVAGIVTTVSRKSGQKGEWGIVTLEDLRGRCTVKVFTEAWSKYRDIIRTQAALAVKGKAFQRVTGTGSEGEENFEVEVTAAEIKDLSGADGSNGNGLSADRPNGNGNGRVYRRLTADVSRAAPEVLDNVALVMRQYQGAGEFVVRVMGHDVLTPIKVSPTMEARDAVERLLGPGAVILE